MARRRRPWGGRKLFAPPRVLQDWDTIPEEMSSKYWELFLDLLLVAASSSVAEVLKSDRSWSGVREFLVLYFVLVNGYTMYSPHITTRFDDSSLYHSVLLFPYLLGIVLCAIFCGFRVASKFALGALLQRIVILWILSGIYRHVERARAFCVNFGVLVVVSTLVLSIAAVAPSQQNLAVPALYAVAVLETVGPYIMSRFLTPRQAIPINIDHTTDRLGCLVLVMLAETVVSATIFYRNLYISSTTSVDLLRYYWTLGLSFLLIFSFTLLYFHVQPESNDSGYHRSRYRGMFLFLVHSLLGAALLGVGVSVRLMVEAATRGTTMTEFDSVLSSCSVGFALLFLFLIRVLHYGGMDHSGRSFPPVVFVVFNLWWCTLSGFSLIPFLLIFARITDPLVSVSVYSGLVVTLCVTESAYTHFLQKHMNLSNDDELDRLESNPVTSYDSIQTK